MAKFKVGVKKISHAYATIEAKDISEVLSLLKLEDDYDPDTFFPDDNFMTDIKEVDQIIKISE